MLIINPEVFEIITTKNFFSKSVFEFILPSIQGLEMSYGPFVFYHPHCIAPGPI